MSILLSFRRLAAPARRAVRTAVLIAAGVLAFSSAAFARDSTWLLGDNGHVAVNTLEHRSASGDGRETDVTLIYGSNFLHGKLTDTDTGKITLKGSGSDPQERYVFVGTISVDYEKSQIKLKGKLSVGDTEVTNYNVTLKARTMEADQ